MLKIIRIPEAFVKKFYPWIRLYIS